MIEEITGIMTVLPGRSSKYLLDIFLKEKYEIENQDDRFVK